MSIKVALPKLPVYYLERTGRGNRLSYYIPPGHLRQMADSGLVNEKILYDYPNGVDIDISPSTFDQFACVYDYVHPFESRAIWGGFDEMFERTDASDQFRGWAYIKPSVLEKFAKAYNLAFNTALKKRRRVRLAESPMFSPGSFTSIASFTKRLRQSSCPVIAFLKSHLSQETLRELMASRRAKSPPARLQTYLCQDLNSVLRGLLIYNVERFMSIRLRQVTTELLHQKSQEDNCIRINRMLIEDAFPFEVFRCQPHFPIDHNRVERARIIKHTKRILSEHRLPKVNPKRPIDRQTWTRVQMTDGINPVDLFIQLQKGQKGTKNVNQC